MATDHGPSAQTASQFRAELPGLLLAVNRRLAVDADFGCGSVACEHLDLAVEYNRRFADTTAALLELGMTERLAEELDELGAALSSRGLGRKYLARMLEAWSIAVQSGLKPGPARELAPLLDGLRSRLSTRPAPEPPVVSGEVREFLALLRGHQRRAAAELALGRRGTPEQTVTALILPALGEIGRLWQRNEIDAAAEHVATEICRYVALRLFDAVPTSKPLGKRALVACVPGEEHAFGAELVAEHLHRHGWEVALVGRSAPAADVIREAAIVRPHAAFLSVTLAANLSAARDLALSIRATLRDTRIIIGGRVATLLARRLTGVTIVASFDQAHAAGVEDA